MNGFGALVSERLTAEPIARWGTIGLALTAAALVVRWPMDPGVANEAWVAVSSVRAVTTAGLALGVGTTLAGRSPRDAAATTTAVALVALAGLPLERIAHAGVAGPLPAWWPWVWTAAVTLGHLAIGVIVAAGVDAVRARFLAPVVAGGYLIAAVAASARWGFGWLDPIAAALGAAAPLWVWGATAVAAAAGVGWTWRRRR